MQVIIKEPRKPGELRYIPNTLEGLQEAVGGYIEVVRLSDTLLAIVDEEGRLKGKQNNVFGLVGTIVLCGEDGDEFTDLPGDDPLLLEVM